jgi:AbrB family looped-hinge helix DNA binding protein
MVVRVGPKGRVVLPVEARRALDIQEGDELVAVMEDDGVRLMTRPAAIVRLRRMFADVEGSLADELIAERRADAAREAHER